MRKNDPELQRHLLKIQGTDQALFWLAVFYRLCQVFHLYDFPKLERTVVSLLWHKGGSKAEKQKGIQQTKGGQKVLIHILFNKLVKLLAGKKFTKNILVEKSFYYLKAMLKQKSVTVNGNILYLDKFDSLALSINKNYEPESVEIIKKHVKKTDVIIDIGANIGYYTVLFAKLGREIHAFEPDPTNFALLKKNINTNKLSNVIPIQKGVSNKNGTINLAINKLNTGGHYITSKTENTIQIETIRLDNYIKQVDFIKMDIEGAEILALNGMPEILKNPDLKLLVEYNPNALDNFGFDGTAFLLLLSRYFTIMDVNTGKIVEDKESFVMQKKITNLFCYKENL